MTVQLPMIKLLIADDHALIRRGIIQTIADEPDMRVTGEAQDAQHLLDLARTIEWDLAILDINMPGRNGLDALKEVKKEYPTRPVLMLSMHPEEHFAVRAFKAGAAGYLTKESPPEELITAIRKVLTGGRYISPAFTEIIVKELAFGSDRPLYELLSDREYEVLRLLASGRTVSEIAGQLALSVKTVSTYRTRVLEKLNLKNNAELMRYAVENQLVL
jgi:two-component system, NarL family, invasion response regulator UvrY